MGGKGGGERHPGGRHLAKAGNGQQQPIGACAGDDLPLLEGGDRAVRCEGAPGVDQRVLSGRPTGGQLQSVYVAGELRGGHAPDLSRHALSVGAGAAELFGLSEGGFAP